MAPEYQDGYDDHRQSDLAVMDAEEYKQKRRLRRILDAHDKVEAIGDEAYGLVAEGAISEDGKNIRILHAVQEYIREAYTLLAEHRKESEADTCEYWHGDSDHGPLGRIEMAHDEDVVFWGLRDVLHTEPVRSETWVEYQERRHGPDDFERRSQTHTVPEEVSMNAFLRLNMFLTEERDIVGLEFGDDEIPEWGFQELHEEDVEFVDEDEMGDAEVADGD